jgi:REP element-mobilizing transposase RayT
LGLPQPEQTTDGYHNVIFQHRRSVGLAPGGRCDSTRSTSMNPIYTTDNTKAAYQLNWSVALFGRQDLPATIHWIDRLREATEPDDVRILEHHSVKPNVIQFLVSTKPAIAPSQIVRSLKGRLQYLLRDTAPKLFRRNYSIRSVGAAKSGTLDRYVDRQTEKHPMADSNVQARLKALQFHDGAVDLDQIQTGTYGQYVNNVQVVLEMDGGWHEARKEVLVRIRNIIVSCAKNHGWKLSRIGLLSNHLHILIGSDVKETPAGVAMALMNNVAYVYEMKPVLKFSYYTGTFGRFDRAAVRKVVATDRGKLDGEPTKDTPSE